jgi:hypothetical protein
MFLGAILVMGCGGTYHYYTDPSQALRNDRYEYVKFNPGAPYNNEILSGKIQKGMSAEEIRAAWGSPTAVAPGDHPGIDEVWAYHDPDLSHGNSVWMLRFSSGKLRKVEKLCGMALAGSRLEDEEHLGEKPERAQSDKP